jgi:hypothetical protein
LKAERVTLYSRNGKIISHSYIKVARALEGLNGDAVKDEAVTTWCQTLAGGRGQVHRMDDKRRNAASRLSWTSRGLAVTGLPVGTRKTA